MHEPGAALLDAIQSLLRLCSHDPWSLTLAERRELEGVMQSEQRRWLPRLDALAEPPELAPDFPAFLLETPAFQDLREAIGDAREPAELTTAAADLLQHFVDRYRGYLRES
jgi:hypothetical protein